MATELFNTVVTYSQNEKVKEMATAYLELLTANTEMCIRDRVRTDQPGFSICPRSQLINSIDILRACLLYTSCKFGSKIIVNNLVSLLPGDKMKPPPVPPHQVVDDNFTAKFAGAIGFVIPAQRCV